MHDGLTKEYRCDCGGTFTVVHGWTPARRHYFESRYCAQCDFTTEMDSNQLPEDIRRELYARDGIWGVIDEGERDVVALTRQLMELVGWTRTKALQQARSEVIIEGTKAEAEHFANELGMQFKRIASAL